MNESILLAEHLSSLSFDDLPTEVVETAKLCVLDTVGVALLASRREWSVGVAQVVEESGGDERSSIWGSQSRTSPQQAALANATAAHGIEMDDRRPDLLVHAGAVVVPAAMAVAESRRSSGQTMLTSIVAGYALGYRVGSATRPRFGIHGAGQLGIWASVGAAVVGLGLTLEPMCNALGLAGSMAPTALAEFTQDSSGTMVKRVHAGLCAHNGVMAGLLARAGITAPRSALEGAYGYCRLYAEKESDVHIEELTRDLGETFRILEREVKAYAAWGGSHTAIENCSALVEANQLALADISAIRVGGSQFAIGEHEDPRPKSIMAAQYSLPFIAAVATSRGAEAFMNPDELWSDDLLNDPAILDVVDRVSLFVDPELDAKYRADRHPGATRVTISTRDGREFEKVLGDAKGTRDNPLTPDEIEQKFRLLCRGLVADDLIDQIVTCVQALDSTTDAHVLGELLRGV